MNPVQFSSVQLGLSHELVQKHALCRLNGLPNERVSLPRSDLPGSLCCCLHDVFFSFLCIDFRGLHCEIPGCTSGNHCQDTRGIDSQFGCCCRRKDDHATWCLACQRHKAQAWQRQPQFNELCRLHVHLHSVLCDLRG